MKQCEGSIILKIVLSWYRMVLMEAESRVVDALLDKRLPGVSNKKVLVVDDDIDIRNLLRLVFSNEGYNVLLAENGEDGIRLARTERPDVVFLDLLMSGLSGLEVCKILKNNPVTEDIPVVVVTAYSRRSDIQLIKESGADWFVKKPFENKRLLELAAKLIYEEEEDAGSPIMFGADMTPQSYLMSLMHAYIDESMKIFPSGLNSKMMEGYFKAFVRFFNLPVLVEDSEKVPLEEFGRIFNLPKLVEDSDKMRLEAVKSKYIDVLNEMGFADKFALMEDPDMYIFQVIGCKYAENYHHSIKSGSFLCPFALFAGALIHSYMNPRIHISKTVLRRGGSITVYKKIKVGVKDYITRPG
jgi:CheY-like chemotaxis protein